MFKTLKNDIPASIVVFFVALPLCLGIALASGAPLFSGLIAGIVGGIVVGSLSGSKIGVSGPAAGLAAIVLTAIGTLGGYENFLVAVVLGGIIQLLFGVLKAGIIGYYFPSSVIKGMLTGIGIIIILKQIPHFFGYDSDPEGDFAFFQVDGQNTFSEIINTINHIQPGSALIGLVALGILLLWSNVLSKKGKIFEIVQGPLVAVVIGIVFYVLTQSNETLSIEASHLVSVPVPDGFDSFIGQFSFPNFSAITNPEIWIVAFTIALVASLETLLCVEATDKLDPHKNVTPTNRELLAQGTGNILSGLIGGLPITQVIVRSSANIQSGGRSKASAIIHGFLLLLSVILIPRLLNMIPLSVLAAILLIVGYKLAKPALFKKMYDLGWKQFIPFVVTVGGIVFTDLLKGIGLGLAVGIIIILIKSYQNSHFLHKEGEDVDDGKIKMTLAEEVTFFNKGAILKELDRLPENSYLELDVRETRYLDNDIIEILDDFAFKAKERNITIKLVSERGIVENPESFIEFLNLRKYHNNPLNIITDEKYSNNKDVQSALTPDSVLQDLLDGNNRFVNSNSQATDNKALVSQTTGGQYPKAVVLSCIDSRVPVETVLDQAIGDIFVARVAGNFENVDILGSLEYSCNVAGSKLILVLGHESCGAVKAACDGVELGNITEMLSKIMPAVRKSAVEVEGEANSSNKAFVAKTVENNVKLTIERIRENSQILTEMEDNGEIKIVGGVYSLHTGRVELV